MIDYPGPFLKYTTPGNGKVYDVHLMSVPHKLNVLAKMWRETNGECRYSILYLTMLDQVNKGIGGEDKLRLFAHDYDEWAAEDATWD